MVIKSIGLFLFLFFSSFSLKAETGVDTIFERCLSDSNLTTSEMTYCTNNAMENWDKELNRVYRVLMTKLNPKAKEALKSSQQQWLKHRDKELEFIGDMYYDQRFMGSMYSNMRAAHRLDIVKDRALELHKYLSLFN